MKKIYTQNNYIIVEDGSEMPLSKGLTNYDLEDGTLILYSYKDVRSERPDSNRVIIFTDPTEWYDEAGTTAYTFSTLEEFLQINAVGGFSNGGGNGDGVSKIGFIDYNDTTGSVSLTANTWTDIPNNGLGAFTNKTYKPDDVTELLDVSTGYIDTSELDLGDTILIRNDYKINPTTNNALLEFRYELGTGASVYTLEKIVGRLDAGSGIDYRFNLNTDLIYMGDLNTKDNAIKLQVKLSTNGSLLNAGSVIQLIKRDINV